MGEQFKMCLFCTIAKISCTHVVNYFFLPFCTCSGANKRKSAKVGRPRKDDKAKYTTDAESVVSDPEYMPMKRPRGRPPKNPESRKNDSKYVRLKKISMQRTSFIKQIFFFLYIVINRFSDPQAQRKLKQVVELLKHLARWHHL